MNNIYFTPKSIGQQMWLWSVCVHFGVQVKKKQQLPKGSPPYNKSRNAEMQEVKPISSSAFQLSLCLTSTSIPQAKTKKKSGKDTQLQRKEISSYMAKGWVPGEMKNRVNNSNYQTLKSTIITKKNREMQAAQSLSSLLSPHQQQSCISSSLHKPCCYILLKNIIKEFSFYSLSVALFFLFKMEPLQLYTRISYSLGYMQLTYFNFVWIF